MMLGEEMPVTPLNANAALRAVNCGWYWAEVKGPETAS